MLTEKQVEEVERLLASGKYSQRAVARMTQVSRGSVSAIAGGKRKVYRREPNPDDWEASGPVVRCPNCGGLTQMPCRLCYVREKLQERGRVAWGSFHAKRTIGVDLRPEHERRYRVVKAWRDETGRPLIADEEPREESNGPLLADRCRNARHE